MDMRLEAVALAGANGTVWAVQGATTSLRGR